MEQRTATVSDGSARKHEKHLSIDCPQKLLCGFMYILPLHFWVFSGCIQSSLMILLSFSAIVLVIYRSVGCLVSVLVQLVGMSIHGSEGRWGWIWSSYCSYSY